nr:hypothetical protein B8B20.270 [imported] - Neurospora crassa [Neurospora crassa]
MSINVVGSPSPPQSQAGTVGQDSPDRASGLGETVPDFVSPDLDRSLHGTEPPTRDDAVRLMGSKQYPSEPWTRTQPGHVDVCVPNGYLLDPRGDGWCATLRCPACLLAYLLTWWLARVQLERGKGTCMAEQHAGVV